MTPFRITKIVDRDGKVLEDNRPEAHDAIRADTAYVMLNLLRGVIERGPALAHDRSGGQLPARPARSMTTPTAGSSGFDPDITVGVWVGFDQKRSLGNGQDGASVALPIWREFMQAYIENRPIPEGFVTPNNIVMVHVDATTGAVTEPWAANAIQESFIAGTQPGSLIEP